MNSDVFFLVTRLHQRIGKSNNFVLCFLVVYRYDDSEERIMMCTSLTGKNYVLVNSAQEWLFGFYTFHYHLLKSTDV